MVPTAVALKVTGFPVYLSCALNPWVPAAQVAGTLAAVPQLGEFTPVPVAVLGPALAPSVHDMAEATPLVPVSTLVVGLIVPPPEVTANAIGTPATFVPSGVWAFTEGGVATAVPAVALWLFPPLTESATVGSTPPKGLRFRVEPPSVTATSAALLACNGSGKTRAAAKLFQRSTGERDVNPPDSPCRVEQARPSPSALTFGRISIFPNRYGLAYVSRMLCPSCSRLNTA